MRSSIEATLRTVAGCEPGSEIVLSYDATAPFRDDIGREMMEAESNVLASVGELDTTMFSPANAEALVERCGLEVAEHLTPDVLYDRYFLDRSDGLRPCTAERLIAARAR
jgi:O-methyltransferase involved in polyketide biosynthesis